MADPTDDQDYFSGLGQTLLGKLGVQPNPNAGLGAVLAQAAQAQAAGPAIPGNTAAPPGASNAGAAPVGYISAAYYDGEDGNPFGHVGASINGGPYFGLDPVEGIGKLPLVGRAIPPWLMGATQLGTTVPGEVAPVDPKRQPVDQVRIPATPQQIQQFRDYMLNSAGPQPYNILGPNCATFVTDGLRHAGLRVPANMQDIDPAALLQDLHKLYDNPASTPKN